MILRRNLQPACFLTWIEHRRTRELCRRLDVELVELVSKQRGFRRYLELIPRTFRFLRHRRPSVVVVQSPSMVLAALALLLRPWLGYRLLLDAHNEAIEPHLHHSWPVLALSHWLIRRADRVIVTNHYLAEVVIRKHGTPIILPDALPQSQVQPRARVSDKFEVVVISTFAGDEPIDAVSDAAQLAGDDFRFFVTGDPDRLPDVVRRKMPATVALTGFLSEADYWRLLASSDAVVDLTTMDNCLVCGAYEAVAVGKPLVLSNNAASMAAFHGFAEFTDNSPEDIVSALKRIRARQAEMTLKIPQLRAELEASWTLQSQILLEYIGFIRG